MDIYIHQSAKQYICIVLQIDECRSFITVLTISLRYMTEIGSPAPILFKFRYLPTLIL